LWCPIHHKPVIYIMTRVYATMAADLFHRGHIEFIKKAKAFGDYLVIGLHPDDICAKYKRKPIISYEDRKAILEEIKGVDLVVKDCVTYCSPTEEDNLIKYRIDLVVSGDDGVPRGFRRLFGKYKYKQVPYYSGISTSEIIMRVKDGERQISEVSCKTA